jgi:hypothetical protein
MAMRVSNGRNASRQPHRAGRTGRGRGLMAAIAVASLAVGVGGTLGYGHIRSGASASPVDAQAAKLATDLHIQLTPEVLSGGAKDGSWHTEADFTALVQRDGGFVLSFGPGNGSDGATHVSDVLLGLEPPGQDGGAASYLSSGSGDVRCYQFAFGDYGSSPVTTSDISCPGARPDGKPGSVGAWLAALFSAQSAEARHSATAYPPTSEGVREFLTRSSPVALSVDSGNGLAAAAFRNADGDCFYARVSAATAAPPDEAATLWLAPADAQVGGCTGQAALAASALYGLNAAAEG